MEAIADELYTATVKVGSQYPVDFSANDMQYAHYVFGIVSNMTAHVGCGPIQVGINGHGILPSGIARRQTRNIQGPHRRSVTRELETSDWVVPQIFAPLGNDRFRVHSQD